MARKATRKLNRINPATGLPWRFRAPHETRVVSSTPQRSISRSKEPKATRVPKICLSGAWLERIGFASGTRFIVLADVPNQILLALADP
jgi:hypothetical protein